MGSRREFLTVAAAFAAGTVSVGTAAGAERPAVTLLNGAGAPRRGLGVVGDFYIDDSHHTIYGPKRDSGWGRPTSLIGPPGSDAGAGAGTDGGAQVGSTGPQGPEGPQGPQGYSVLHGDGPPAAGLGEDNDFYIDTATTQLYGPREGGVWGSPVSLTGAANIAAVDGDVTTIRLRRGTAAQNSTANPTLAAGEIGIETDTGKFKIGDGATAWNALAYATDLSRLPATVVSVSSGGDPRLRRATAPYLRGQIAVTRCGQANGTSTATQGAFTGRVAYTTGPTETADLRLCFSNWITVPGGSLSEGSPGQPATIKAAIEIPQGTGTAVFPVWFDGVRVATLADGAELWSDPVGVELAAGAVFHVRVLYTPGDSGTVYPEANIFSTAADSWVAGDSVDATGALANSDVGAGLYRPTAITGTPVARVPQVVIIGDERAMGNSDAPTYAGYINTALGSAFVTVNLGADQDRGSWFVLDHPYRGRFIAGCDYAIETYGGKDIDDSDSAASIQAARLGIWQLCKQRDLGVYADTIPPYTSSSDGWTTTANQAHAWSAGQEATRVAVNQWIRAGAPIINGVAVTPGTANALLAGGTGHPLTGVIDVAARVETQVYAYGQGTDSGIWKVGSGPVALTANGYSLNSAGCTLAAAAVPVQALV